MDAYVRRLVGARVSALGFGLEPYFDAVPDAVVQACRRHNLTLVAVPKTVPFAAVGLEFSQLLESDNATTFRQLADTNRQLMRAVLSARPEHELLAALVQRVPVWAVLVGADGRVRARGTAGAAGAPAAPARTRQRCSPCWRGCSPAAARAWSWTRSARPVRRWSSGIPCAAPGTPTWAPWSWAPTPR